MDSVTSSRHIVHSVVGDPEAKRTSRVATLRWPRYRYITHRLCNFGYAFHPVQAPERVSGQLLHSRYDGLINGRMRNHDLHRMSGWRTKMEECRMALIDPCNDDDPPDNPGKPSTPPDRCHRLVIQLNPLRFPLGFPFQVSPSH